MMRLYRNVRRSRSSAIDGINLGFPAEVPELQMQKHTQSLIRNPDRKKKIELRTLALAQKDIKSGLASAK